MALLAFDFATCHKTVRSAFRQSADSTAGNTTGLFTAHELNWTELLHRPSYTMRSLVLVRASWLDWLPRNYDRWCLVSPCAVNTSIGKHVFTLQFANSSPVQFVCCEQTFLNRRQRAAACRGRGLRVPRDNARRDEIATTRMRRMNLPSVTSSRPEVVSAYRAAIYRTFLSIHSPLAALTFRCFRLYLQ